MNADSDLSLWSDGTNVVYSPGPETSVKYLCFEGGGGWIRRVDRGRPHSSVGPRLEDNRGRNRYANIDLEVALISRRGRSQSAPSVEVTPEFQSAERSLFLCRRHGNHPGEGCCRQRHKAVKDADKSWNLAR